MPVRIEDLAAMAARRDPVLTARFDEAYGAQPAVVADAYARLEALARHYIAVFGAGDDVVVVRAPGRVNLIGEHTDYNGLPVMPMAISRDVMVIAGAAAGRTVRMTNVDNGFPERTFDLQRHIPPFASGDWANYIKSAIQGLIDHWDSDDGLHGLHMATSGNVPIASGLSSSAAFTIGSALAVLASHGRSIEPVKFADTMARSDHYVGMASGGMDQAASILGRAGMCLKIDFFPLRTQPVLLPPGTAVVVCQSRVSAAKAGNARDEYNRRVTECRLATAVLHKLSQSPCPAEPRLLSEWLTLDTDGYMDALGKIASLLHVGGYRMFELERMLGILEEHLLATLCTTAAGRVCNEPVDGFQLKRRSRHVITEAHRVEQALAMLRSGKADAAAQFGDLMNTSHESCRSDYHISCPELDALVGAARSAGALGARLTGAGFGGCTVNLVRAEGVQTFMRKVTEAFYTPNGLDNLADNMFEFVPAAGASVLVQ